LYQTKNYGVTRGTITMQVSKRNIKEWSVYINWTYSNICLERRLGYKQIWNIFWQKWNLWWLFKR